VKFKILGAHTHNGSVEDEIGFLSEKIYPVYTKLKNTVAKDKKKLKSDYHNAKDKLFSSIMSKETLTQEERKGCIDFLTRFGVIGEK